MYAPHPNIVRCITLLLHEKKLVRFNLIVEEQEILISEKGISNMKKNKKICWLLLFFIN